jgi:predicted glycoside hydrolase/deacetylase ChbG (UPF0249 family)
MRAMLVVVNVDDLGLHAAVRRAVEDLAALSRVSSATLLVNAPDAPAAARLSGSIGVGVHLNILRGSPMSPPAEIPGLLDGGGLFLGDYAELFRRYVLRAFTPRDVEREWTRQVERALELGVKPTHVDSEKHIHAWPGLFEAACRVARRFGIGWVRRPLERVALTRWDKGALRARVLQTFCFGHNLPGPGVSCPDCVFGVADQGADLLPERLAAYMKRVRPRVLEVVCHPGAPLPQELDGAGPLPPEYGKMRIAGQWSVERDALAAPGWPEALAAHGARLAHYGQIDPATRGLKTAPGAT